MNPESLGVIIGVLLVAALVILVTVTRNLYVCSPSEVLIFSGRRWKTPDSKTLGFRVVRGGRAMRMPLFEVVDRMQLTNMAIELAVQGAYSKGGVPLSVTAIANIKIPSEEPLLHNAIERFLGYEQQQIMLIAKDTLEANLRGVIAELTPEEINQKKVVFQQKLIEEADRDLHRLGLVLDNLQIQNISDDVGYLTSVGRVRGAKVRRDAAIGEVRARATAAVQKAQNTMAAEIAKIEADIQVARKENERRIVEASTQRQAVIAEVCGEVQAQVAEARAQLKAWDARVEQVRRKLEADVVAPADAERQKAEANAKAWASQVVAQGKAAAASVTVLSEAYKASGVRGRDALLLQKLMPVFEKLAGTLRDIKVDRLVVLGSGDAGNGASAVKSLISANEQVRAATGVDLVAAARARIGAGTAGSAE
ncbi:MAG TPA: SPFH domain-containing protein [Polyangiaceae bacterium]|nr:SPFH domain-containing protein [Polyangiaceae bacterium]